MGWWTSCLRLLASKSLGCETTNPILTLWSSSLERIESSNATLVKDTAEIKKLLARSQETNQTSVPPLSLYDDEPSKSSLSAALMQSAEVTQSWSTIGVDQWVEAGRWWLFRSRSALSQLTVPQCNIPVSVYTDLVKAAWIPIDVIACHPQMSFLTSARLSDVQLLSVEVKAELQRIATLQLVTPNLDELLGQDLTIWELAGRGPPLRSIGACTLDGKEQVLFQGFGTCRLVSLLKPSPCLVLMLVSKDAQNGQSFIAFPKLIIPKRSLDAWASLQ